MKKYFISLVLGTLVALSFSFKAFGSGGDSAEQRLQELIGLMGEVIDNGDLENSLLIKVEDLMLELDMSK